MALAGLPAEPLRIPLLWWLLNQRELGCHRCPLRIQVRSNVQQTMLVPRGAWGVLGITEWQLGQPLRPAPKELSSQGLPPRLSPRWLPLGTQCSMFPALLPPQVLVAMCPTDPLTSHRPLFHVVVLGGYDRTSRADSVQVKNVVRVVTNPNWNPYTLSNDIALLKLASPAKLGPRVSPVCLPPPDLHLPDNLQCVTTGWGRTSVNSYVLAESLQQVSLPLISSSKCAEYWGSKITSSMVCAGGVGASSCQGDSGGPLVYQDGSLWTLIGIVSWGSSNCNVNTPSAYTRVSHFRNWINNVIQA
ncbi:chymotrypsin-like protease CTRL-1 isoform X1 [Pezoporus occidentalis]|uniref:chymotrypsin-like protease CTRL-1 isoform X1 n=1 Tax=Pezoporus occidentalis TaxID=407982 RepID=UPI002F90E073